ncbi:MAG: peptide deformylase [Tissierellales bacterium]|jgi:peptide deformylase|nr:peptide deformylase [Tissierellales bacterium]
MAIRKLRTVPDPILRKKTREVEKIDERLLTLLDDMLETMAEEEGVGLAAPQIGILKRIAVIDIGDGPVKLVNPYIVEMSGSEIAMEACLSVPGESGAVERPTWVKVKYLDLDGVEKFFEAEGFFARAVCHELDHLDGVLYIDKLVEEEQK